MRTPLPVPAIDVSALASEFRRLESQEPESAWKMALQLIGPSRQEPGKSAAAEADAFAFDSVSDRDTFRSLMGHFIRHYPPTARVLVVAGGSGSGKTTLTRTLLDRHSDKFIWLRRSTTRPPRAKDGDEDAMHRFMSAIEFEKCADHLYGVTRPYGYRYGFLLDDILSAMLSGRTWLTNVMVHRTELASSWPQMKARSIGLTPVQVPHQLTEGFTERIRDVIQERIRRRDEAISQEELAARVEKACPDTEFVCRIADRVVVNAGGVPPERVYIDFERAALDFYRSLKT